MPAGVIVYKNNFFRLDPYGYNQRFLIWAWSRDNGFIMINFHRGIFLQIYAPYVEFKGLGLRVWISVSLFSYPLRNCLASYIEDRCIKHHHVIFVLIEAVGVTGGFWLGFGALIIILSFQLPYMSLFAEFSLAIFSIEKSRTLMSSLSWLRLWRMLDVPDFGLIPFHCLDCFSYPIGVCLLLLASYNDFRVRYWSRVPKMDPIWEIFPKN